MCYRLLTGRELGLQLPSEVERGLSTAWDQFIKTALRQESQNRYAGGQEMLSALATCQEAAKSGVRRAAAEPAAEAAGRRPKGRTALLVAVAGLVLLGCWLGWYYGMVAPEERRRKAELARLEAEARAATDAKEKARLDAEAERLRTEREKQQAADKAKAEAEQRERDRLANARGGVIVATVPPGARVTLGGPHTNSLGMKFVPVPGTKVLFCIWETRVKDYAAYAAAKSGGDGSWKDPKWENVPVTPSETWPVVNVSWDDALAFCRWLTDKERKENLIGSEQSYRLLTDAEWSWAVGIGDRETGSTPKDKDEKLPGVYPWGTAWPPPAGAGNFADATAKRAFSDWSVIEGYDDGIATTSPVGSYKANPLGIYDLSGNVWEWCEDFSDGQSENHVLRGGCWNNNESRNLLSSNRNNNISDNRSDNDGFRVVLAGLSSP
jgi:type II secretory pathway component PulM